MIETAVRDRLEKELSHFKSTMEVSGDIDHQFLIVRSSQKLGQGIATAKS